MDTNPIGKPKTELNWKKCSNFCLALHIYRVSACVEREKERETHASVPTCTCIKGGVLQKKLHYRTIRKAVCASK